ncbi:hypothetical protein [Paraburkholderia sp.]|uniref:hypothetical protein n=1 Tax=Paraburkholderia sp. TaxID=1926495 RepID=UPI0039E28FE4
MSRTVNLNTQMHVVDHLSGHDHQREAGVADRQRAESGVLLAANNARVASEVCGVDEVELQELGEQKSATCRSK